MSSWTMYLLHKEHLKDIAREVEREHLAQKARGAYPKRLPRFRWPDLSILLPIPWVSISGREIRYSQE